MNPAEQFAEEPPPSDVRPLVGRPTSNVGLWAFGIVMVIVVSAIITAFEFRREKFVAPRVTAEGDEQGVSAIPDLYIPPAFPSQSPNGASTAAVAGAAAPSIISAPQNGAVSIPLASPPSIRPSRARSSSEPWVPPPPPPMPYTPQPPLTAYNPGVPPAPSVAPEPPVNTAERAVATHFARPSTTVAKGTIIPAVLETALDSSRAGYVRAVISRDVASFDGTRVLIPRGSRILGEYKSDLTRGQKRALIQWQRLTRPDGVIIDIDSPAADPLGRAGVTGKIRSGFMGGIGDALLQPVLNVGSQVAFNSVAGGGLIYAVPSGGANPGSQQSSRPQPRLTVEQGTSVSVFVAKDLDFTNVSQ